MRVFAIFADTTTPSLVFRRSRRQVNCSAAASPAAGAVGLRGTARLTAARGAAAAGRAATAAFAGALAARAAAGLAGALARGEVFVAVFAVSVGAEAAFVLAAFAGGAAPRAVFSGTRLGLPRGPLAHDGEELRDLSSRSRERAEVLELPRRELELRVEELLARAAQLIRDLVIRQPSHVLHPYLPPLSQ